MKPVWSLALYAFCCSLSFNHVPTITTLAPSSGGIKRFELTTSGLELSRLARPSTPFDVVAHQAAVLGNEAGTFEMWAYPLKVLSGFRWTFRVQGDSGQRKISADALITAISVRPECTILTYTHPAFTMRQIIFVPVDEPAAVLLLDIDTERPLTLTGSFQTELKLMWPAESSRGHLKFDKNASAFVISSSDQEYAAMIGSPALQESRGPFNEQRNAGRARFTINATPFAARDEFIPIVIVGAPRGGVDAARRAYRHLLRSIPRAYQETVAAYRQFREQTLQIITPDARLNQAFEWAKIRLNKGYADNPFLGSGLLAGFRASGTSQRPGFAWFFGRDALWSSLATTADGDFERTRGALQLLRRHQRADGKIMHELSQAASFVNWAELPYYYASADSTPLYLIVLEDYYQATGDLPFIRELWASARKAYDFCYSTDRDGNSLIENTQVGHGWVEGGRLLPVHEEIYLQGLWIQAGHAIARLAKAVGEQRLATLYQRRAERARAAVENLFWNEEKGIYAFGRRRQGSNYGGGSTVTLPAETMINELTVMPTVPMWWGLLEGDRGARMVERIASADLTTDWGTRLLSNRSPLYDPLSYHFGSVWPLFTGWASVACYRYRRPLTGYELLMANAALTYDEALGAHTELLSGDRYRSFDFSSFDQVWSSAMVINPLVRGLLGVEWDATARRLTFAPQLPANWHRLDIRNLRLGESLLDLRLLRQDGHLTLEVDRHGDQTPVECLFLPSFPLDARVTSAKVNGQVVPLEMVQKRGDQIAHTDFLFTKTSRLDIIYTPGTQVLIPFTPARLGDRTRRLKLLRTDQTERRLRIELEGRSGHTYAMTILTPRPLQGVEGADITAHQGQELQLAIRFPAGDRYQYTRKSVLIQFSDQRGETR